MKTIALHFERLRRHYEAAVRTYDYVSFLDLSHSLRIWVELKNELSKIVPAFGTTMAFKTAIPARKVLNAAKGHEYVFSYMPGGVITYGANGHLASGPGMKGGAGDFSAGIAVKLGNDHVWLNKFCFVGRCFDQPLIKALEAETTTRCNYVQWLGSEVVRVAFRQENNLVSTAISREMLVKRVANTLDGSHASLAAYESDNTFDPAVHYILRYQVGGLPLPYFILLKIAQDILAIAPKLLGMAGSETQHVGRGEFTNPDI